MSFREAHLDVDQPDIAVQFLDYSKDVEPAVALRWEHNCTGLKRNTGREELRAPLLGRFVGVGGLGAFGRFFGLPLGLVAWRTTWELVFQFGNIAGALDSDVFKQKLKGAVAVTVSYTDLKRGCQVDRECCTAGFALRVLFS